MRGFTRGVLIPLSRHCAGLDQRMALERLLRHGYSLRLTLI